MIIYENYSLKSLNTFGIACNSSFFVELTNKEDIVEVLSFLATHSLKTLIIGQGSNLLFQNNHYDGLVILNRLKGIKVISENNKEVIIEAQGGEIWDDFVQFCVKNEYYGVENLSLIPGTVGATPVQNIGAYGVEIRDVFHQLTAVHLSHGLEEIFQLEDCKFAYRDSIFKSSYPDTYLIKSVQLRLSKTKHLKLDYPNLREQLSEHSTIAEVRQKIIEIRERKLPSPDEIGNVGSFFKNPIISAEDLEKLKNQYPKISYYPNGETFKLASGWLIDQAGWKGKRLDKVGVHKHQALVLLNYGGGTGKDILALAKKIKRSVFEKFGVSIEMEVRLY